MTSMEEMVALNLELADITTKIRNIERKLDHLKRKPESGIRLKLWSRKVLSLVNAGNEMSNRALLIQKRLAALLKEAGVPVDLESQCLESIETTEQSVANSRATLALLREASGK